MSVRQLLDPIIDQGIRHTNYFEGRLLTAQDLRDQQGADRERSKRLGRALGQGIIEGLEVVLENDGADGSVPVVTVKRGLALNGEGEVIGLPSNDVQVALSRSLSASPTTEVEFYACAGPPTSKQLPNGVGVYILVMSPAAGYKDRAPKSGLGDGGVVTGCGSRYVQEGVKFRLVELAPKELSGISEDTLSLLRDDLMSSKNPVQGDDVARLSLLQNILAHLCFGTETEEAHIAAINLDGSKNLEDKQSAMAQMLDSNKLSLCDIPISLLYWTLNGIAFIDNWSVRRSIHRPALTSGQALFEGNERHAVAEAMLFQFQSQLNTLVERLPDPPTIQAIDYFRYLPPIGVIPVSAISATSGVISGGFFWGMGAKSPIFIEGSKLRSVTSQALNYPAIDVRSRELVWLYRIQENARREEIAVDVGSEVMLFMTGYMPYIGHAQFNLSRWNYSNYEQAMLD